MMPDRAPEASSPQPRTCTGRKTGRGRGAARSARPVGGRAERWPGPAARPRRDRSRLGRRPGARRFARAVRGSCGFGLCRGGARPADGGWACGLDRTAGRAVRAGPGRARGRAGAPDRGPRPGPGRAPLGARGGVTQLGPRRGAGRDRPADPDPEPAAAARRRGQGGERGSAPPDRRRGDPERGGHPLADRPGGRPRAPVRRTGVRPAPVADRPVPQSRRADRQLAGGMAEGRLA